MTLLKALRLRGLLSFAPDSESIPLTPLNVLIGPNGSGKSNLIEAIELLHATPSAFADAIRAGGGARDWLWKGPGANGHASIEAIIDRTEAVPSLRYQLDFTASGYRTELTNEVIEESQKRDPTAPDVFFYYRFQAGKPAIKMREVRDDTRTEHNFERALLVPDESILSQRKDPLVYPELSWLGQAFGAIQIFGDWSFGRHAAVRRPQPVNLPSAPLAPDSRNLGLILNHLLHGDDLELNRWLQKLLPRYQGLSTRVDGGTIQIYLHEQGLKAPVPAARLSDGTIRFLAMLTVLLNATPAPLVCIEAPELGLHPDAVALLAELLVEASQRMQLIVTTHSDALVSALTEEAESVLVCDHIGQTVMNRVESAKLKHWLGSYRLGEIWRIGQLGGNP